MGLKDFFKGSPQKQPREDIGSKYFTVLEVANIVGMSLSIEEILQQSVDLLVKKLKYESSVIFVNDSQAKKIVSKTFTNKTINVLTTKLIGKSFDSLSVSHKEKNNYIVRTVLEKKIFQDDTLSHFIVPVVSKRLAGILQKLSRTGYVISLPILYRDQSLGAIMFTKTKKISFEDDIDFLKLYSNQIAVAIYNSQQYDYVNRKNAELESLYSLTSNISQTLDPEKVVQTAVNSIPLTNELVSVAVFSYDEPKQTLSLQAVTENKVIAEVKKIVGGFENYVVNTSSPEHRDNLLYQIIKNGKQRTSHQIKDIFTPFYDEKTVSAINRLMKTDLLHLYPLRTKDQPTGVIVYFLREKDPKNKDSTSQKEPNGNKNQLLATYAFQISIALENALLYQRSEQTQRYLREARRRERDMVDVMGHELRTPISIVRNALLALEMDYSKNNRIDDQEKLGKYLDMAIESTKREIRLIETLLSATKVEGNKIQLTLTKVDMKDVINDGIEGQKDNAAKKGLVINYEEPPEEYFAFVDRVRVQEIMDNFLSNSIKYTADGHVDIKIWEENNFIYVEIKDTGIGISKANQEKLGHKFFRVKELFEGKPNEVQPSGTGLGLFVTFNLVDIMRGERRLWSEKGKGSSFIFGFPKHLGQQDERLDQALIVDEGEEIPESIIKEEEKKLNRRNQSERKKDTEDAGDKEGVQ